MAPDLLLAFFNSSGFVFELLFSIALFTSQVRRRRYFAVKALLCVIVMVAVAIMWDIAVPYASWAAVARCLVFYLCFYAGIRICLYSDLRKTLLYLVAGVTAQHLVYCGAQLLTFCIVHGAGGRPSLARYSSVIYVAALIPFFICVYFLFARRIRRMPFDDIEVSARILLLVIGVFLSVTVFASIYNGYTSGDGIPGPVFVTFIMTRMITCIFLLELLAQMVDRFAAVQQSAVLQQLLSQQKKRLAADRETIDLINIKTHDLKKQLSMLNGRIPGDEINGLRDLVTIYDSTIRTGNDALDVLLTNKSLICRERSIQLERMIDGSRLSFMKPQDIYSLFGNAVDNAIEAVTQIRDASLRYVRMTVRESKGMVIFHIENPYTQELEYEDSGAHASQLAGSNPEKSRGLRAGGLVTSKADKQYHGFGVKSIGLVAQQYGGTVSIDTEGGIFSLDVMIPSRR